VQTPRGDIRPEAVLRRRQRPPPAATKSTWDIIRIKLKEIVDREDKNEPLSDDALVDRAGQAGLQARPPDESPSTASALKIPSSRQAPGVLNPRVGQVSNLPGKLEFRLQPAQLDA